MSNLVGNPEDRFSRVAAHFVFILYQVVNVWEYNLRDKRVDLKQPLYGHTEPVTSVAASSAYHIIVSGSRDRTCIIWDLSRLVYVRQLRGHTAPVAAVCVNELTVRFLCSDLNMLFFISLLLESSLNYPIFSLNLLTNDFELWNDMKMTRIYMAHI